MNARITCDFVKTSRNQIIEHDFTIRIVDRLLLDVGLLGGIDEREPVDVDARYGRRRRRVA